MAAESPPMVPMSRSCDSSSRLASASPMLSSVKRLPLGRSTTAPRSRQRAASGMSWEITTSPAPARSAIQSSAASNPPGTTTSSTSPSRGVRIDWLATTQTFSA